MDFPKQLVSSREKQTKKWQEDCVNYLADNSTDYSNLRKMKSREELRENYNLLNGVVDPESLYKNLNPLETKPSPEDLKRMALKFYDLVHPVISVLQSEELKRKFAPRAYVITPDAVNEKDQEFKDRFFKFIDQKVAEYQELTARKVQEVQQSAAGKPSPTTDEDIKKFQERLQKQLKEIDNWYVNDLQTAHERLANSLINYALQDSRMNTTNEMNKAWLDVLIQGYSVLKIEISNSDPYIKHVNLENFTVLGLGESNHIEDAQAWIEHEYVSLRTLMERYHEELSRKDIEKLTERGATHMSGNGYYALDKRVDRSTLSANAGLDFSTGKVYGSHNNVNPDDFLFVNDANDSIMDEDGNFRLSHVYWISIRKIGKKKSYNPETAEPEYSYVSEYDKADPSLGEEIEWLYVSELWEGKRVLDIIFGVKPSPVQMRDYSNPARVLPPYVGYIHSIGHNKPSSLIDKIKPLQEDFNVWLIKLRNLWVKHQGKIAVLESSRIPKGMNLQDWYAWVTFAGFSIENAFEKADDNTTLAGHMTQGARDIDLSFANEIQHAIQMLDWIKIQIEEITGINNARRGNLGGREGLGVVQHALQQSSYSTEFYFHIFEQTKAKALNSYVEYVKFLWKDKPMKRQYLLDGLQNHILDFNPELFTGAAYGVAVANSAETYQLEQDLRQYAFAAFQNNAIGLGDIITLRFASGPASMKFIVEQAEEKRQAMMMQQQQEIEQAKLKELELIEQQKMSDHQRELEKMQVEYEYKAKLLQLQAQMEAAKIPLQSMMASPDLILEQERMRVEQTEKQKDREHEKTLQDKDLAAKKELEHIKAKARPVQKPNSK